MPTAKPASSTSPTSPISLHIHIHSASFLSPAAYFLHFNLEPPRGGTDATKRRTDVSDVTTTPEFHITDFVIPLADVPKKKRGLKWLGGEGKELLLVVVAVKVDKETPVNLVGDAVVRLTPLMPRLINGETIATDLTLLSQLDHNSSKSAAAKRKQIGSVNVELRVVHDDDDPQPPEDRAREGVYGSTEFGVTPREREGEAERYADGRGGMAASGYGNAEPPREGLGPGDGYPTTQPPRILHPGAALTSNSEIDRLLETARLHRGAAGIETTPSSQTTTTGVGQQAYWYPGGRESVEEARKNNKNENCNINNSGNTNPQLLTSRLIKELDDRNLAIQKMGRELVRLRELNSQLEATTNSLRTQLSDTQFRTSTYLRNLDTNTLTLPELQKRYASLLQTLQADRDTIARLEAELAALQAVRMERNELEREVLELRSAHRAQSGVLMKCQEKLQATAKYPSVIEKQERVIAGLQDLLANLGPSHQPTSSNNPRTSDWRYTTNHNNINATQRGGGVTTQPHSQPTGPLSPPPLQRTDTDFASLLRVERAEQRARALENELFRNSRTAAPPPPDAPLPHQQLRPHHQQQYDWRAFDFNPSGPPAPAPASHPAVIRAERAEQRAASLENELLGRHHQPLPTTTNTYTTTSPPYTTHLTNNAPVPLRDPREGYSYIPRHMAYNYNYTDPPTASTIPSLTPPAPSPTPYLLRAERAEQRAAALEHEVP
ncbi:hypothetical protein DFJ77DRAFT_438602 [Powellomyces hirtus]|nr:hypothetical protein DFJ77DRAFT_438602 [Powellomyces hirtus]